MLAAMTVLVFVLVRVVEAGVAVPRGRRQQRCGRFRLGPAPVLVFRGRRRSMRTA